MQHYFDLNSDSSDFEHTDEEIEEEEPAALPSSSTAASREASTSTMHPDEQSDQRQRRERPEGEEEIDELFRKRCKQKLSDPQLSTLWLAHGWMADPMRRRTSKPVHRLGAECGSAS